MGNLISNRDLLQRSKEVYLLVFNICSGDAGKDKSRKLACEMKCLRSRAGVTKRHKLRHETTRK